MAKRKIGDIGGEPEAASVSKRGRQQRKRPEGSTSKKAAHPGSSKRDDRISDPFDEEPNVEDLEAEAAEEEDDIVADTVREEAAPKRRTAVSKAKVGEDDCCFIGKPVQMKEARQRWPHRYQDSASRKGGFDERLKAKCHYREAKVDDCIYRLHDSAYVKADEGDDDYICRIVEFFETFDGRLYFTARWFFRAKDTVIKNQKLSHGERKVFLSEETDDNELNCIVSKVQIYRASPNIDLTYKTDTIPPRELYFDMAYSPKFSTYSNLSAEEGSFGVETPSSLSSDSESDILKEKIEIDSQVSLLDLYSGCGAMSTGLCHGAHLSGLKLHTCWAVDLNPHACESLKKNHPNTEVRNEKAEDFLSLLHEWDKLCKQFGVMEEKFSSEDGNASDEDAPEDLPTVPPEEFEVGKIVGICYGETENLEKLGLKFKVRWKGYGPDDDTWEPADGLSKCQERIHDFVRSGYRNNILPLPGRVDVICGGPPCQGVSGFNRFRKVDAPLDDPKNYQLKVFMDIVDYLKPKYVLMENVVDILKFAGGYLGRYALSQLLDMNYQARLGILPAGSFGLPQFRLRAFLWGAYRNKKLPQFPLPTHEVVPRGCIPTEFELNVVPFKKTPDRKLERALFLEDAISDLPKVANDEDRDEMDYENPPKTDFQTFIRRSKEELLNISSAGEKPCHNGTLFDHRPLKLKDDDYLRVCKIPKAKGANFRNLYGVIVGTDNVVQLDPNVPREMLPSGKPLVPDYAISFVKGKSVKPFGRLWWDETIATVVTRAEPHNQALLHPEQDRVLTIRENARIQGFPDHYKLYGPVKERYIQVGNAVAVPVSRALGYALGLAYQEKCGEQPTFELPAKFPNIDFPKGEIEFVED